MINRYLIPWNSVLLSSLSLAVTEIKGSVNQDQSVGCFYFHSMSLSKNSTLQSGREFSWKYSFKHSSFEHFVFGKNLTQKIEIFITQQINWPWRTTQFHTVLLCLYLADPATFLASNSVVGPHFLLRRACLFRHGKNKHFWVCITFILNIAKILILSLNFFSKTTQCPFKLHLFTIKAGADRPGF